MICPECQGTSAPDAVTCLACGAPLDAPVPSSALPEGTPLHDGAYTVVGLLAQGGFGVTYHCLDTRLACEVAIKEFFPDGCVRQGCEVVPGRAWSRRRFLKGRERFLQEGETLARFRHPGIVGVRAAFEENGTAYIVMELLRGRSLARLLTEQGGPLDEATVTGCVEKLAAALATVHEAGLLHRDLKPSNVVVTDDGRVVLIDFGSAREYAWGLSRSHTAVLTAGYAPLEQYSRRGQRGPFTDVYGLAATCWHLLTGQAPPDASDRAVGLELPLLRSVRPDVRAGVAEAVDRGLAMDPLRRPQSVEAFLGLWMGALAPPVPAHAPLIPAPLPVPPRGPAGDAGPDDPTVDLGSPALASPPPPAAATPRAPEDSPRPPRESAPPSLPLVLIALAVAVVLGALALVPLRGGPLTPGAPRPSPGAITVNEQDASVLVAIPGGDYRVGSTPAEMAEACDEARRSWPGFERRWLDAEGPAHTVRLASYCIGRCEVTNAQYRRFVAATGFRAAGSWEEQARQWGEDAPVVCVSWGDAVAYCDWAGLRLPTEEEWEVAARGPAASRYPWGNDWDASRCCGSVGTPTRGPEPVGRHPGGASWCGALDMAGNAWEWTASWFDAYAGSRTGNPAYGQRYRVFRGGSWNNASPVYFRGATRVRYAPPDRFNDVGGFRCARSL